MTLRLDCYLAIRLLRSGLLRPLNTFMSWLEIGFVMLAPGCLLTSLSSSHVPCHPVTLPPCHPVTLPPVTLPRCHPVTLARCCPPDLCRLLAAAPSSWPVASSTAAVTSSTPPTPHPPPPLTYTSNSYLPKLLPPLLFNTTPSLPTFSTQNVLTKTLLSTWHNQPRTCPSKSINVYPTSSKSTEVQPEFDT